MINKIVKELNLNKKQESQLRQIILDSTMSVVGSRAIKNFESIYLAKESLKHEVPLSIPESDFTEIFRKIEFGVEVRREFYYIPMKRFFTNG